MEKSGGAMKKLLISIFAGIVFVVVLTGCAATVYAPGPPPEAKVEVQPAPPGPGAVWVAGHWVWHGNAYVWQSGYWEKNPKGRWVTGHWKKTPRGHVWVAGHWAR